MTLFISNGIRMKISWENQASYLLLNSNYSQDDRQRFYRILDLATDWPGHFWLSTSGSSIKKWVGLSKEAMLSSAQAVNQHLSSHSKDRWVNPLPSFHVGGLAIFARAFLTGAQVFDFREFGQGKWKADAFYNYAADVKATLTALVPTQLHDLVLLNKRAPSTLRGVVIGGGELLPDLYDKAMALGWPILPSYGMTECASQIATAPLESCEKGSLPPLKLLSHIRAVEAEGRLAFSGPSLLSVYAFIESEEVTFIDPKQEGWFISEDLGVIKNRCVTMLRRADKMVKIGGENVDLASLENHLQTLRLSMAIEPEVTLIILPDQRLGSLLICASNSLNQEAIAPLVRRYQDTVLPFERIRKISLVPQIPRSCLGKIMKSELISLVSAQPKNIAD